MKETVVSHFEKTNRNSFSFGMLTQLVIMGSILIIANYFSLPLWILYTIAATIGIASGLASAFLHTTFLKKGILKLGQIMAAEGFTGLFYPYT